MTENNSDRAGAVDVATGSTRPTATPSAVFAVATGLSWMRFGINETTAMAFLVMRLADGTPGLRQ